MAALKYRIETLSKVGVAVLFVTFFVLVGVSFVVGRLAPEVYLNKNDTVWRCPGSQATFTPLCTGHDWGRGNGHGYTGEIGPLTPQHQMVALAISPINKKPYGLTKTVNTSVTVEGGTAPHVFDKIHTVLFHTRTIHCAEKAKDGVCDAMIVFHEDFIHYPYWRITVNILEPAYDLDWLGDGKVTFVTYDPAFTTYEAVYRSVLLALSIAAVAAFIVQLCRFRQIPKTADQKWILVLLFALILLNNPFFTVEIISAAWFWSFINSLFIATFASTVMFHLLVAFHSLITTNRGLAFYLPKAIIVGGFWILLIVALTWVDLHSLHDPSYPVAANVPAFIVFGVIGGVLLGLWVLWMLYLGLRIFATMRKEKEIATRFRMLFALILICVGVFILGIAFYAYLPRHEAAADYLTLFTVANLYVFLLAAAYSPSQDQVVKSMGDALPMATFEEQRGGDRGNVTIDGTPLPESRAVPYANVAGNAQFTVMDDEDLAMARQTPGEPGHPANAQ